MTVDHSVDVFLSFEIDDDPKINAKTVLEWFQDKSWVAQAKPRLLLNDVKMLIFILIELQMIFQKEWEKFSWQSRYFGCKKIQ